MEKSREVIDEQGVHLLKHSDGSDCIGCSPPPRLRRQAAVVDLYPSSDDSVASQSQESLDASDSFLPSIPEDEEEAMEDDPDRMSLHENALRVKEMIDEAMAGKSYLN